MRRPDTLPAATAIFQAGGYVQCAEQSRFSHDYEIIAGSWASTGWRTQGLDTSRDGMDRGWGYVNSYGTFQAYYVSALNESPSTISWIGSVQVWILFFLGAFSGRALDAGYFLPAYVIGIVIQVLGIFMTSLATKYWQLFLTQAVCTGIGSGIFFCPSMALLSTYFSKHRGVAVALATTGNSAGE
ncbi:hypothetical protein H2203_008612 [Taxawa tesnikishii (nom. ined.)]|nr:hypothetical protein H2203_008612 [Dothideales sp. JES 119]